MGNQLVGIAPSQIFPVEHYMSELGENIRYISNLGSTRFFKVALAQTEGSSTSFVVVKVFTIPDQSFNLLHHRDTILELRKILDGSAYNCLPFHSAFITEKAGFLVRQYVKYSLYDRISTRPFLRLLEKKWLAFQLLLAVDQHHRQKIFHGDIKLENILVNSWNWLLLSDFASFKPTFLPEDNPADFSYFFDTSRRRTCSIAPERFRSRGQQEDKIEEETEEIEERKNHSEKRYLPDENEDSSRRGKDYLPSMDIFSVGCVLIELFTEGVPPFSFSQLLAYRANEYSPNSVISSIQEPELESMLHHMIQKDPKSRYSAKDYLNHQRGLIFPEYFYSFAHSYLQCFSSSLENKMSSDNKMRKINSDLPGILLMISSHDSDFDSDGLVLISNLVTAHIRSLEFCDSKIMAIEMILSMIPFLPDDIILDRILPYIMHLLSDEYAAVRTSAITAVTKCVQAVSVVELYDANIFLDYILPTLLNLSNDRACIVRNAVAKNISDIAQTSVRFLDLVMLSDVDSDRSLPLYETELGDLHNCIAQAVSLLLADHNNLVKQTLLEYSVTKLAVFFGKQKANDVLLSHMITFLNDKEDGQLRHAFYTNIVGVVSFIGWQCSIILFPLLQQGLSDPEEFVITACILAMGHLAELGLHQKIHLYDLLKETVPYLLHPNLWIRQATASFISSACSILDEVDVQVKIGSILRPYLKRNVIQIHLPVLLLSNVQPCIPRALWNDVVSCSSLPSLFRLLDNRRRCSLRSPDGGSLETRNCETEIDLSLQHFVKRLQSEGMTSNFEDILLTMRENLIKMNKNKKNGKERETSELLDLKLVNTDHLISIHSAPLTTNYEQPVLSHTPPGVEKTPKVFNEEWNHMFGSSSHVESSHSLAEEAIVKEEQTNNEIFSEINDHQPSCMKECEDLIFKKQYEYSVTMKKQRVLFDQQNEGRYSPCGSWKPRGTLVAHLHEHEGCITKLVRMPDKPIFASASTDGCVRLWDCKKMEKSNIANKAHRMYNLHHGSPVNCLSVSQISHLMASGAKDGSIVIFEPNGSIIHTLQIDLHKMGPPMDLHFCETGTSPLLMAGTSYGSIIGWDLRTPISGLPSFLLKNNLKRHGIQTALAVSSDQIWAVSGTSSGHLNLWDLRFSLPVIQIVHPSESRIRSLLIHPKESSTVVASVQGNNEVGIWNMESQCRKKVLWASDSSPLSLDSKSSSDASICAMFSLCYSSSKGLLTGGTDHQLRFWDLTSPSSSFSLSGVETTKSSSSVTYKSKIMDGIEVIYETKSPTKGKNNHGVITDKPRELEEPCLTHRDWISAITMCNSSRWYVISGSRNGVIKIWK